MTGDARSLLAILAHPDDDLIVGPLLAHYAKAGACVTVAFLTSGKKGASPHAGMPPGEELAEVREEEARCACKAYGVGEPVFLREEDGTVCHLWGSDLRRVQNRLAALIAEKRPQSIVTFGPEGFTGHWDHKAVSNLVTDLFARWDLVSPGGYAPHKLYYPCFPAGKYGALPQDQRFIVPVNDRYVSAAVPAEDGVEDTLRAVGCYKTQFTPQMMESVRGVWRHLSGGVVYLRLALSREGAAKDGRETDIL